MEEHVNWMEEAREQVAQCWCEPETKETNMDPILAEVMAKKISFWMEVAAMNQKNTDYYRGLLEECGENIGKNAYISDDGSVQNDVLCAKIPELVAELCKK